MTELLPYQLLPAAWIVGWTLVHFLWQATLVAAVASFVLACVEHRGSAARYMVCALSLVAMAIAPVVTFSLLATAPAVDVPSLALTALVIAPDLRQRVELLVPGLTLLWVAGVWVMQVRIAAQLIGARGLARTGTEPLAEPQAGMVRSLCTHLGLPRAVKAYQSTRATVPMVVGWLRPVVLVPSAALAGLSTAQLRAVLAHELAHIKRHDALVNLAQSVFESLFFFHPAVWWLSNRLREEREFCCDDVAVATCGDPLTYAKALAALDDARSAPSAAALAATGGSLMQRITRLLDSGSSVRRARSWIAPMIMTLSLTAVVSAMSLTVDEEPDASVTLKGVDLVKVVAPVDGELAEILTILSDGGMDDATLLEFVSRLGTSPEVVTAIQGATENAALKAKHVAIKEDMAKAANVIKHDAIEGLITKEEANLRMTELHRKVEQRMAELGSSSEYRFLARLPHPEGAHAGEAAKLHTAHSEVQRKVDALEHKLHALEAQYSAGTKAKAEVAPAMEKIKQHLNELRRRQEGLVLDAQLTVDRESDGGDYLLEVRPVLEEHLAHENNVFVWEEDELPPPRGEVKLQSWGVGAEGSVWSAAPVWVNEPQLIEEVALEPLEPLEVVDLVDDAHDHEHGNVDLHEAQNLWSVGLHESAVDALHDRFLVDRQSGVVDAAHEHLLRIHTVLRELHLEQQHQANVLIDSSLEPIVEHSAESDEWIELEEIEDVSEEPVEWVEEVVESDDT